MYDYYAQFILAGPGDDTENWMNILFLVVLAVFWVVGGIIKATSQKSQDKRKQSTPRQPVRKTPRPAPQREPLSKRPMQQTAQSRPRESARPSLQRAQLEKSYQSKDIETILKSKPPAPETQGVPMMQEFPEFASKPFMDLGQMRLDSPHETSEGEDLPELIFDDTDPDELTKAILHYEILGPPVSLRNPSHQATDL